MWRVKKSPQPVLALQTIDAGELTFIRGHQGATQRECMRGYEEIVRANGRSLFLQICSDYSVCSIRWRLKGLYDESLKSFFNASFEFEGCVFRYAEA